MEHVGVHPAFFLIQLCNFALLLTWLVASVVALLQLRKAELPPTAAAIWAAVICIVPVLGAIAFFIVRPGEPSASHN